MLLREPQAFINWFVRLAVEGGTMKLYGTGEQLRDLEYVDDTVRAFLLTAITLEATGTMLLGTEIGAALTSLETYDIDILGMNCATGPKEMNDAVRYLGHNSTKYLSSMS